MITVKVTTFNKNMTLEEAWKMLSDIQKYNQRVKFVRKVTLYTNTKGTYWDDITTILWIPLKIKHKITSMKKNQKICYDTKLPLNGFMKQNFALSKNDKNVFIEGTINFDLGNKILNNTLGIILKKRLTEMLGHGFLNLGGEIYN